MDIQTTQLVFCVLMTIGCLVWAHSLVRALQMQSPPSSNENPWVVLPDPNATEDGDNESGRRTVRGQMETVSRAIARAILGQNIPGTFSPMFQITERTSERVVVKKDGPIVCNQPPSMQFSEVEFDLRPVGESTVEVEYRIQYGQLRKRCRTIALGIILGLGLPVLLGVGLLLWLLVVNHPDQNVRWQVMQTLQISHVLWPPFLFIHRYNSSRKHSRTFVSNMLMMAELADGVDSVASV